jgi:Druantia protein DruA
MQTLFIQGRRLAPEDLDWIRGLISAHRNWGRFRLSVHIAEQWQWRNGTGRLKDMAARTLLLKLQRRGLIELPARRAGGGSRPASAPKVEELALGSEPAIEVPLGELQPVELARVDGRPQRRLLAGLLGRFHYLGYRRPVGENVQYLARDRSGRPLACLVFGAAAWKCAARDQYIGWDGARRQARLHLVANNMRLLVLPWVGVSSLASHLLGLAARRLSADWREKYGHGVCLLESFVERERFEGRCYRAANWMEVGQTQGRGRNDRERVSSAPCKKVYLYPLARHFRRVLLAPPH